MKRVAVFGATGFLGGAIQSHLNNTGDWEVVPVSRTATTGLDISTDVLDWAVKVGRLDGVVWAHGQNSTDSVLTASSEDLHTLFDSNVVYVAKTLKELAKVGALTRGSRGVVLSSVWQETARANKFSYVVSKSALRGLITSVAIDMGEFEFAINGVLPGVVDSPMTRERLSPSQIRGIETSTPGQKLANADDVANVVTWLLSSISRGVNAEMISVDHGWGRTKHV